MEEEIIPDGEKGYIWWRKKLYLMDKKVIFGREKIIYDGENTLYLVERELYLMEKKVIFGGEKIRVVAGNFVICACQPRHLPRHISLEQDLPFIPTNICCLFQIYL